MLQVPAMERCMKLADEILTDGFVTDTEPLMLNGSRYDTMGDGFVPPWGDKTDGGQADAPRFQRVSPQICCPLRPDCTSL